MVAVILLLGAVGQGSDGAGLLVAFLVSSTSAAGRSVMEEQRPEGRHRDVAGGLARINYHIQEWVRAKYKKLRPVRAMQRAWRRVTAQNPGLLPHWRWVTGAWY
jgi:hypothetical protein